MEVREISGCPANGSTIYVDRESATGDIPWNQHPKFEGVCLKHLIKGADTEGMVSCHLVRIDPHKILEEHIHENLWELHEVIAGDGTFILESKMTSYHPGRMAIIPKGAKHEICAGENGLVLLAKFFPALI